MFQSIEPQKSSKDTSHKNNTDSKPSGIDYSETLKGFGRAINSGSDTAPAQLMVEEEEEKPKQKKPEEELKQGKLVQRKPEEELKQGKPKEEGLLRAKTAQQKPLEGGFLQRKTAQRKPEEELKQGKLAQRKPEEELKQGKPKEEGLLRAKTAQQKPLEGGFLQRKAAQKKPEEELKQGKLAQRKPEEEIKQGKPKEEGLLRAKTAQQKPLEGGFLQRKATQRKPEEELKQGKLVQKQEEEELQAKTNGESTGQSNGSSGSQTQMPEAVQSKMENSFGTSFSGVNIQKDSGSATEAGAKAYAQGENIHFAPGEYNPNTQSGQELLGHELTHVVQQRAGRVKPDAQQGKGGMNINSDKSLENEADVMGAKAAQGKDASMVSGKGSGVQRKGDSHLFASNEKKDEYINNTKHRLTQSQGAYGDAILEMKSEIKTAAEKVPSMASIFVDIAFGFLIPGVGKIASRMVNNVSAKAPDFVISAALLIQNENFTGPILSGLGGMGKKAFSDFLVSQAVQTANGQTNFADILYQQNGTYVQEIREGINIDTPDMQVLNLYNAYDFNIVNKESYKAQIRSVLDKYKSDVLTINEALPITYMGGSSSAYNKLAYVMKGGTKKLAIVQEWKDYSIGLRIADALTGSNTTHYFTFGHWVSDEMKKIAISKVGGESNIPTLSEDQVSGTN